MDVKLIMFKRDGHRKDFRVNKPTTVIGRGEDCSLRIPLLNVSRKHCELLRNDEELQVRDMGSANGTYVNNRRVNEAALKAGDRLAIGPVVFTVQIDGQPQQINPVKSKAAKAAHAVGKVEEEEVVELEADVVAEPAGNSIDEEIDPIAALEAMAEESKTHKKKK